MWFLNFDYQFFTAINSLAGKYHWLDLVAIICAKYLIFVIFGAALGWWISLHKSKPTFAWPVEGKKKWLAVGHLGLTAVGVYLINNLIALIHFRERPFLREGVKQMVNPMSEKSFPSDHAAASFAVAAVIFFYNKALGGFLFVLAILVGLGRIYTGVHYPLDVLGGAVVGILTAMIVGFILKKK
ncbi:MAG TPA: phosphatase PAP2 family protein [bacterium]|nr:phosphatase PAP2 family protein [bacterium]